MKQLFFTLLLTSITSYVYAQSNTSEINPKNEIKMKLNAGIVTKKLIETKNFYQKVLNFGVTFENDFYVLMHTPDKQVAISFLLPNHPTQQPLFQKPFMGQGMFLTIEVENVDQLYQEIKKKGINIVIDIRNEIWGDRHFAIQDPNGIGIDIVKYTAPEE